MRTPDCEGEAVVPLDDPQIVVIRDAVGSTDAQLTVLRRARTLARLRAAGLSDIALSTLLPDFAVQVEQVAARSSIQVGLTIAD